MGMLRSCLVATCPLPTLLLTTLALSRYEYIVLGGYAIPSSFSSCIEVVKTRLAWIGPQVPGCLQIIAASFSSTVLTAATAPQLQAALRHCEPKELLDVS